MRIALTLGHDATKNERNDYIRALLGAGFTMEEIVVLPPGTGPEGSFDGVLLGGGLDVDPAMYGVTGEPHPTVELDPERDKTDFAAFEMAKKDGVPVLGICRGMQLVNVALGGTLHQDIPSEVPSDVNHMVPGKENERRDHAVEIKAGTRLAAIARAPRMNVNSRHHQAIERLAPGLEVSAVAPDGLIEAFETRGPWLVAVQWHPENLLRDPASRHLFDEFARVVRERAGAKGISRPPDLLTRA